MTHYSNKPGHVRVSLFRDSGKWAADGMIDMSPYYDELIHDGVLYACRDAFHNKTWPLIHGPDDWLADGGMLVVLEPYHKHAHPIMLKTL